LIRLSFDHLLRFISASSDAIDARVLLFQWEGQAPISRYQSHLYEQINAFEMAFERGERSGGGRDDSVTGRPLFIAVSRPDCEGMKVNERIWRSITLAVLTG